MDALFTVPEPYNEPVRLYAPGSTERESLRDRLSALGAERVDLTMTVDGVNRMGGGAAIDVVAPHHHRHVLGVTHNATNEDAAAAVAAAKRAAPMWRALPYSQRSALMFRAAGPLFRPWRATLQAAPMLGQSQKCFTTQNSPDCSL